MSVLTLNAGSSSLKVALYDGDGLLARGLADRIGEAGTLRLQAAGRDLPVSGACEDHAAALAALIGGLRAAFPRLALRAVRDTGSSTAAPISRRPAGSTRR